MTVVPGESVGVRVWGDPLAPFALLASVSATSCSTLPGLSGALALDPGVLLVSSGVLTLPSPCLACPPAHQLLPSTLPPSVPVGTTFALQAVTYGLGTPGFSRALTITVI